MDVNIEVFDYFIYKGDFVNGRREGNGILIEV